MTDADAQGGKTMNAAERLMDELADECGHKGWSGDCPAPHRCCRDCALKLLLAFAEGERADEREACAKAICIGCRGEFDYDPTRQQVGPKKWAHGLMGSPEIYQGDCRASAIWARGSLPAPAEPDTCEKCKLPWNEHSAGDQCGRVCHRAAQPEPPPRMCVFNRDPICDHESAHHPVPGPTQARVEPEQEKP